MSFLDAFEDVFIEPDNAPTTTESPTEATDSHKDDEDYFDREDEPVIW